MLTHIRLERHLSTQCAVADWVENTRLC